MIWISFGDITQYVKEIGEKRGTLEFDIDGAVIKVDNFETRNLLGSTSPLSGTIKTSWTDDGRT